MASQSVTVSHLRYQCWEKVDLNKVNRDQQWEAEVKRNEVERKSSSTTLGL